MGPRLFNSLIDEVEIFNRALCDAEIQAIFNAGSAAKWDGSEFVFCSDPLLCYVQPKHVKVLGIHANNQFGPERLDTVKEEDLCVPSEKIIE